MEWLEPGGSRHNCRWGGGANQQLSLPLCPDDKVHVKSRYVTLVCELVLSNIVQIPDHNVILLIPARVDMLTVHAMVGTVTKMRRYTRPSPQDMWRYVPYSCMYVFAPGQLLGRLSSNCNYCKPFRHLGRKKRQRGCPNWRRSCSAQMQWIAEVKEWAESAKDGTIYIPFCSSFLTDICVQKVIKIIQNQWSISARKF